jgi:hypothetical protein
MIRHLRRGQEKRTGGQQPHPSLTHSGEVNESKWSKRGIGEPDRCIASDNEEILAQART